MAITLVCLCRKMLAPYHSPTGMCPGPSTEMTVKGNCACVVLQDGEYVVFSEVDGMPELNKGKPFKVLNCKVGPDVQHSKAMACTSGVDPAFTADTPWRSSPDDADVSVMLKVLCVQS